MGTLKKVSYFTLEGRFVGFVSDFKETPKRIQVATAKGEFYIKLSKELRRSLREALEPGDWVQIIGEQKLKYKTGELKLKAFELKIIAPVQRQRIKTAETEGVPARSESRTEIPNLQPPVDQSPVVAAKPKACVMVCQKSSCRKRGADEVYQSVTESIRDHGLEDQVAIKGTGCMKQCKHGPCMVFMPDKSRYIEVAPQNVDKLVEKHFAAKLKPEEKEPELSCIT